MSLCHFLVKITASFCFLKLSWMYMVYSKVFSWVGGLLRIFFLVMIDFIFELVHYIYIGALECNQLMIVTLSKLVIWKTTFAYVANVLLVLVHSCNPYILFLFHVSLWRFCKPCNMSSWFYIKKEPFSLFINDTNMIQLLQYFSSAELKASVSFSGHHFPGVFCLSVLHL